MMEIGPSGPNGLNAKMAFASVDDLAQIHLL